MAYGRTGGGLKIKTYQEREALSVPEVAKRFGKSARTVRNWIHRGQLAAGRPTERGPYLIRAEEVRRLTLPHDAPSFEEQETQTAGE